MERNRFGTLTHSLHSYRSALGDLLGGSTALLVVARYRPVRSRQSMSRSRAFRVER